MFDAACLPAIEDRIHALERQNRLLEGTAKQAKRIRELWHRAVEELTSTKQVLQQSNDFLDRLLNTIPLPVLALSHTGRIVSANKAAETLLGAFGAPALGLKILQFVASGQRKAILDRLRSTRLSQEGIEDIELTVQPSAGTKLILAVRWARTREREQERQNIILVLRDVTETRRAEHALRMTQFSVDHAMDACMWLNRDGTFRYVNQACCRLLGYTEDELLSMRISDINGSLSAPSWLANWTHVTECKTLTFEGNHRRPDGRLVPLDVSVKVLRYGDLEYICIFAKDISEKKRNEAEQESLQRKLIDASRKAGMAEVASGVLHNIGNVLNSLNVSACLVSEMTRGLRVSGVGQVARLMKEHTDDLAAFFIQDPKGKQLPAYLEALSVTLSNQQRALIDELKSVEVHLDHVKCIVAAHQSHAGPCDVAEPTSVSVLVNDALTMNISKHHDIEIIRDYQDLPKFVLDRHKVLQILINLIRNAKQSLRNLPGGKRLIVRVARVDSNILRFQVIDNGDGITSQDLGRIFEYGFTTKQDGHGFGLHTSAVFAQNMGATLKAESAGQGQGATFTLDMPYPESGSQDD